MNILQQTTTFAEVFVTKLTQTQFSMKTNYGNILFLVGLISCSLSITAQQESAAKMAEASQKKIRPIILFDEGNTSSFARSSNDPEVILGLLEGNNFVSIKQTIDNLGHTHKKYKQTFRGVEVVGGSASMNSKGPNYSHCLMRRI